MRVRSVVEMMAGSVAIYVVVAACSASHANSVSRWIDGGGPGGGGKGGGPGLTDALTDPVAPAHADDVTSGTRLKANRYVGSDGSSEFAGTFHDTMLGVDCAFGKATDGTIRCIPLAVPSDAGAPGSTVSSGEFFSDPGCTMPLGSISTAMAALCTAPVTTISVVTETTTCAGDTASVSEYEAGPIYTGMAYTGVPSDCSVAPSFLTMASVIYSLGAQKPAPTPPDPSAWVQATIQTDM